MVALWIDAHALDNADQDNHDRQGLEALSEALAAVRPPEWYADALCAEPDYPLEWWFPERGQSTAPAKEVCSRCIVADECDRYADNFGPELVGIWAGIGHRARATRRRMDRELGAVA